jgi:AraC-like DNA-binding protein
MYNFKPRVLQCNRFILKTSVEHRRVVKDYELDLYLGEERNITVDGRHYTVPAGALVYRRPGELVVSKGNYDCFVLTLDLSGDVEVEQQDYRRNRAGEAQGADKNPAFSSFPTVFFPKRLNEIKDLFKRISSCSYPSVVNDRLATLYTEQLLYLLLADLKSYEAEGLSGVGEDNVERICAYINKNYKNDVTIDEISREVSLNKNYMIRMFRERMGKTPIGYLIETRLFYSSNMLASTTLPVADIALECGFNSSAYFTKVFKEHYRMTPLEFRKKYRIM